MARRESLMVLKDTARLQFADPTTTYFTKINYLLQTDNIREATPEEVRKIELAGGKLRVNKPTYVLAFDRKLFTLVELQAMLNAVNAIETKILEVVDYPTFVSIADADYRRSVRWYLPNRSVPAEVEGDPDVVVKWNKWTHQRRPHRAIAGVNHIPLKSDSGVWISVTDAIALMEETTPYTATVTEFNGQTFPQIPE
jgi:hypothetical protein